MLLPFQYQVLRHPSTGDRYITDSGEDFRDSTSMWGAATTVTAISQDGSRRFEVVSRGAFTTITAMLVPTNSISAILSIASLGIAERQISDQVATR